MADKTPEITLDSIELFVHQLTGFRADAAQTDALRVMMQTWAAGQALSLGGLPADAAREHIANLQALAVHLLDKGEPDFAPLLAAIEKTKDLRPLKSSVGALAAAVDELRKEVRQVADPVNGRLDRIEKELRFLQLDARNPDVIDKLGELDGKYDHLLVKLAEIGTFLREGTEVITAEALPDLAPVTAQLEALTRTVLATRAAHDGEITAMAGDLASICEDIEIIRARTDTMPAAYIPLEAVGADFFSQQLPANLEEAAEELVVFPEAAGKVILDEPALNERAIDSALDAIAALRKQQAMKPKKQAQDRPGCFWNPDGTISCRDCGKPKDETEYFKDARAYTGRKAACKQCEHNRIAAKKLAS